VKYFFKKLKERYFTRGSDTLYFGALKRIVFVFILLVFILFIAMTSWLKLVKDSSDSVKVPDVKGMNILDASEILQKRRLTLKVVPVLKNDVPRYQIIQQIPSANTTVKEGRTIEVVVSSGQAFSRMPDFKGKDFYTVRALLMGQKLVQGIGKLILVNVSYVQSPLPVNTVIGQIPKEDAAVTGDVPVSIIVSNGFDYSKEKISNYTGMYFERAVKELNAKNLRVKIVNSPSSADKSARILSQSPQGGSVLSPGDVVTLTVGTGTSGRVPLRAALIKYVVPIGQTSAANLKIIVSDAGSDRIIFQGDVLAGEKLVEAFMYRGSLRYKIFINDKLVKDGSVE
jgi:beta-lactam-binding protein with PASTA domain